MLREEGSSGGKRRSSFMIMKMHSKQNIEFIQKLSISSNSYLPLMDHYINHQDLEKCLVRQKQHEAMAKILEILKLTISQRYQQLNQVEERYYNLQQSNEDRIRKRHQQQQQLHSIQENNERLKSRLLNIKEQHLAKKINNFGNNQPIKEDQDEDFGSVCIPEPSKFSISSLRAKSQQGKQANNKPDFRTQKDIHGERISTQESRDKKSNSMRQASDGYTKINKNQDISQLKTFIFEGPNLQELMGKKLQSNIKHKGKTHELIDRARKNHRPHSIVPDIQEFTLDWQHKPTPKQKFPSSFNSFRKEQAKQPAKDHDNNLVRLNPDALISKFNIFGNDDEDSEEEQRIIREDVEFMTKFNQKCKKYTSQ